MKFAPIARYTVLAIAFNMAQANAQISYFDLTKDRNLMLNFGGGVANYFGDFVNPGTLGMVRPSINVEAEYYFWDHVSARTQLGWFQIAGKDAKANDDRWERNLNFRSNVIEFTGTAAIHLFPQISTFYPRPKWNPYGFFGAGVIYHNPKTSYQGDWVALQPLRTENEDYSRFQFVVPAGLGMKVQLNPYWNLIAEGGFRWTFTDYLDDVSRERYFQDLSVLGSPLARALHDRRAEIGTKPTDPNLGKRGNPDKNDNYLLLNLKLQYYLPVEIFKSWEKQTRERKARRIEKRSERKATGSMEPNMN